MLTHLNIVSAATSITTYLENTADDIILNVLPLSFDYGLYQVLMTFKVGATLVLERSFTYPHAVLETLVTETRDGHSRSFRRSRPSCSRSILASTTCRLCDTSRNTGAALPDDSHPRAARALCLSVKLFSMYGLTECKRVSYLPPEQLDTRPDVGRTGHAERGGLYRRRAGQPTGVWRRRTRRPRFERDERAIGSCPRRPTRMLRPGPLPGEIVLYSGDLFRMDDEGYLYFVGRKDDIIKTRGEKVSPREVENVLYALAAVAEAAVVGIPDDVLGQAIKAVVTLRDGAALTEQDVLRHCSQRLESFMVPKLVEFRTAMPKTSTGKIDKKTLHLTVAG